MRGWEWEPGWAPRSDFPTLSSVRGVSTPYSPSNPAQGGRTPSRHHRNWPALRSRERAAGAGRLPRASRAELGRHCRSQQLKPRTPASGSPRPDPHTPLAAASSEAVRPRNCWAPTGPSPRLLPGAPGPSRDFPAQPPPRSSSRRLPGRRLPPGLKSHPISILRPLPALPTPKMDPAPPRWRCRWWKTTPDGKEAERLAPPRAGVDSALTLCT